MPSRADVRRRVEQVLRAAGLAALVLLLIGALGRWAADGGRSRVESGAAEAAARWTVAPPADTLVLTLDAVPDRPTRAWLAALRRAGTTVRWAHRGVPAIAVEAVPRAGPLGGVVLRVAGPDGRPVPVRDALGPLDSLRLGPGGGALLLPRPVGPIEVGMQGYAARTGGGAMGRRRAVVLGAAGWESRFVLAALEETGWEVDPRIALAPGRWTRQGRPLPLDTARHGVVVLLDSVPADVVSQVVGFVRAGGGVVVGTRPSALGTRRWLPGVVEGPVRPSVLTFAAAEPRAALVYRPIEDLRPDAVPLEVRDGAVIVAARRERAGRVVQVGYEDTWRWRMQGGADAPAAHAAWWSELVAAAAYRPERSGDDSVAGDPAPYAALVDAIGLPVSDVAGGGDRPPAYPWLLVLAMACLVGEWASRRLRGAA